ncbi:hypothetical protein EB796_020041 [Bugula neritina]|uniref:Uncharacterized protein n=1 Tax=Bugula neritina TaxID=10212 RepID=A0A7J7J5Y9_BUGNE|nr:hypothetical protein EB796_020041 [Bugula neritina]
MARSPTPLAKSPPGSKLSSRRESFMFFWGLSTESALSDGNDEPTTGNSIRQSIRRKYSDRSYKSLPLSNQPSLSEEFSNLYHQYNNYKRIIEELKNEYEETKNDDAFRRYPKMKSVIKRCVMYTKLGTLPDVTGAVRSAAAIGNLLVRNTGPSKYHLDIASVPRSEMPERVETLKKRISRIRCEIDSLEEKYESSKRYFIIQRYRLLKAMIKETLLNCAE